MKCSQCGKDFYGNGKLLNADGDFACSAKCEEEYIKERNIFFNEIVHSSEKTKAWLLGDKGKIS